MTPEQQVTQLLIEWKQGNQAAVEITGLCGYYTMVAMTLNAFGIGTDAVPNNQTSKHQNQP